MAALPYRHPEVQRLRRLGRRRAPEADAAFLVEGAKLVGEALAAAAPIEAVFVDPTAVGPADLAVAGLARAAGCPVFELDRGVLGRVAATVTPQPVLAVARAVDVGLGALARDGVIVLAADVRDPGNLGTVLRSAEAAGARGVVCPDGTVDPYNPKCVRASAGALFHVPLVVGGNTVQVLSELGTWGLRRLGASARGGEPMWEADLSEPLVLVLGNEASGLAPEVEAVLDGRVTVPIDGRSESLNVGTAAAVLVYEAARQRRAARAREPGR